MKKAAVIILLVLLHGHCYCWGFYAHKKINHLAVFLLPPRMLFFYKANIAFITEHATDPDKRKNVIAAEGPRHYIDIDHYGQYPYGEVPHRWSDAVKKFTFDSLERYGIVPWHIQVMLLRLTQAFKENNYSKILKNSADIGHYIADAHVPLHTNSNHNGQLTNQQGIHAFWESRVPELLADKEFNFFIGKAEYIADPVSFMWNRVLESGKEADSVLTLERELNSVFPADRKYAFEQKDKVLVKQYSSAYTIAYNKKLNGMVERRMRQAIYSVASFWYTAWVNAGQPDLTGLIGKALPEKDQKEFEELDAVWKSGKANKREHE